MISDERLREAARQAEEKLLASLPKPEDCEATFSPEYKRKMKKLARRTDHPIIYWVQKAVACILLTILIGGGGILTFSTEARAAFVGWVREVYNSWFVYKYIGENSTFPGNVVYCPEWVPDGYELVVAPEPRDHMVAIYENQSNDIIIFNCYKNTESMNLQIGQQGTLLQEVYVGDIPADLYIDSMEDNINHLIWEDSERKVIFWISSTLDGKELVKIAESVELLR